MITKKEASELGHQVAAFVKAVDEDLGISAGVDDPEKKGNFLIHLATVYTQSMIHGHPDHSGFDQSREQMFTQLEGFMKSHMSEDAQGGGNDE